MRIPQKPFVSVRRINEDTFEYRVQQGKHQVYFQLTLDAHEEMKYQQMVADAFPQRVPGATRAVIPLQLADADQIASAE